MDYMLIIYNDGQAHIVETVYQPAIGTCGVHRRYGFTTLEDAQNAKAARMVAPMVHEDLAMLHSDNEHHKRTIDIQARVIRDNAARIEALENELAQEYTKTRDRETVLHNVMGALALDMALERTHQQRNAAMRHIVRLIKRILDNVGLDADDIPF